MDKIIPKIDRLLSNDNISLASGLSSHVNDHVFSEVQALVSDYITNFAELHKIVFTPQVAWLDEGWEIIQIDSEQYRFGIFIDHLTSSLQVVIDSFVIIGLSGHRMAKGKIDRPGLVRSVVINIATSLAIEEDVLCDQVIDKINDIYSVALVDYRAALRDYCVASASDDLYDVLRKSGLSDTVLKEITLYCVFNAMGRHIPSIDRISEIIARIYSNASALDICPIRLATDFFLTPLESKHSELYTQKAFREGKTITATGTNYSGESYVRLATEVFFKYSDVNIQPIHNAGDAWLLSAIYPSSLGHLVQPVIDKLKPEFKRAVDHVHIKHRDMLTKLKQITGSKSVKGGNRAVVAGKFLGGLIQAFTE